MKEKEFKKWLSQKYVNNSTVANRLSNCKNVENVYGNLDVHFEKDECLKILGDLIYTIKDERKNKPAKHKIEINGDIRTGSATLKQAVKLYVVFREELLETNDKFIDSETIRKLNRDLISIGKSTFIKYYYDFKKGNDKEGMLKIFKQNKEKWKNSSPSTKANVGIRIFKEGIEENALNLVLSSCGIDKESMIKANEIYSHEFSENDVKNYLFIHTEFDFGNQIIENLFSNYEIQKEFKVLNYKLDWYIPELKLAIEFDEKHHKSKVKEDTKRQKQIEKKLGCKFIRYSL